MIENLLAKLINNVTLKHVGERYTAIFEDENLLVVGNGSSYQEAYKDLLKNLDYYNNIEKEIESWPQWKKDYFHTKLKKHCPNR